jgi:hypothetical protein
MDQPKIQVALFSPDDSQVFYQHLSKTNVYYTEQLPFKRFPEVVWENIFEIVIASLEVLYAC